MMDRKPVRQGIFSLDEEQQPKLYGPIKNVGEEQHRRLMFLQEVCQCTWYAELKAVHYSTYRKEPAALIIIECNFSFTAEIRFTSATITLSFDRKTGTDVSRGHHPRDIPEVIALFPLDVYGQITEIKHRGKTTTSLGANTPEILGGAITTQINREHEKEFTSSPRKEIHGSKATNQKASRPLNVARWVVKENTGQTDGISRRYLFAVIVKYGGKKFFAQARIKVHAECRDRTINPSPIFRAIVINAWPWPNNDPVKFNPDDIASHLPIQNCKESLEQLTDDDYRNLAPLQEEFKVRISTCLQTDR